MKVVFKDESFAFEFVRNLGFMYYGGSDLGEMMATAGRITEGDFESWFTEWDKVGQRTLSRADASLASGHRESARTSYLRASTYFRTAEFYLHGNPADPRILSESRASQKAYAEAAKLTGPIWEPVAIPYEGTTLPGYFYKVDDSGKPRPTLIFHGGLDSSVEELFYFGAAAAIRRGYNCLTFDGPGQGAPIREQKLPFRYDWEAVVTPAVDYVLTRPDVDGDNLALMGMSMGGYLAARAAAFEHRFRAAVFFDGAYDLNEATRGLLPKEAVAALDAGDTVKCEEIIHKGMQYKTGLRWSMAQSVWSFGASNIVDFLKKIELYTMVGIAGQIQCPCLVMEAEADMFLSGQPQQIYDALKAPKQLVKFTSQDGAENHCQSGALAYKDEVVFNWLDETLRVNGGNEDWSNVGKAPANAFARNGVEVEVASRRSAETLAPVTKAMRILTLAVLIAGFAILIAVPVGLRAQEPLKNIVITPYITSPLERDPSRVVRLTTVLVPPGGATPFHRHPGDQWEMVQEGEITYTVKGEEPKVLKAGDVVYIPRGTVHRNQNLSGQPVRTVELMIVDKDKPHTEVVN